MPVARLPTNGGNDSLAPLKQGEGWGQGFWVWFWLGHLIPSLSCFAGGEGFNLAADKLPLYFVSVSLKLFVLSSKWSILRSKPAV